MSKIESLSTEKRDAFIRLIAKHTGLEIRERDQIALSEKILSRIHTLRLNSPTVYFQLLESTTTESHEEWLELIVELTNIESYFFRDREQFSLLQNHIFPELLERKQNSRTIRICSAGCSSGEEPYSIAILLRKLIPNLEKWNLMILGVDINQAALKKAKTGIYSPWSFRSIDPETKQQYFQMVNNQYHIDQRIKNMVEFKTLNLIKDEFPRQNCEFRDVDLILCRNVFIYFETSAIAKVLNKFYQALQPLGYLLTGHAELSNQNLSQFQTKMFSESFIYQCPVCHPTDTPLKSPAYKSSTSSLEGLNNNLYLDENAFENEFEKSNIKMQQIAVNLLRQLPPDTRIQKLGNQTAAELILQIESELKATEQ
ncbi:MAG: protein-glutamate O-methyltransferase CheR [Leptolyngbyaceae cyanobacterium SM1_4_3]|nr:protein-glutamate O-methyltransferase CheR [Leptolyngbyaceae cyanobacterium SM1_4_3]